MHAPSALLVGAVLTFGAAAFANLYLPASPRALTQVPSSVSLPAPAQEPAPTDEEVRSLLVQAKALSQQEPLPEASSGELSPSIEPTTASASASAPAASPASVIAASPPPVITADKPSEPVVESERPLVKPKTSAVKRTPNPKLAELPQTDPKAVRPSEPTRTPAIFAAPAPSVPPAPQSAGTEPRLAVSAISGTRAWVRIGDSRTLAVQQGDLIPGVGRVQAVNADSVSIEGGRELRVAP